VDIIRKGSELAIKNRCDLVIAYGGGSVIDAGKAIAAFANNHGDIYDYLEVVGRGQAITHPALPIIAIPTTAGTGAEVTRNSVLGAPQHKVKVSVRSSYLIPTVALVDPELTYSMPPNITAATGMDALSQLVEPFVSQKSNPFTDMLCRDGITRVADSLKKAYDDGDDQTPGVICVLQACTVGWRLPMQNWERFMG
jgi:alcohol dehydrogenase class IV